MIVLKTVDAHVSGSPLRLVVDGYPSPGGRTMAAKQAWADAHADHLRAMIMREPRGHAGMRGAVLTEAVHADAHAGVLFMDADGYHSCSFHAMMAVAALAVEHGLITAREGDPLRFDTAAGRLRVDLARGASVRTGADVVLTGCPSFVLRGGIQVSAPARSLRADLAFGGAFYGIVDSEAAGVPIDGTRDPELHRTARQLAAAMAQTLVIAHPTDGHLAGLRGVIFTGPAQHEGADFRMVAVTANGRISRGPSATGLAAVLAVLDAMGLPIGAQGVTLEGAVGTRLTARIAGRVPVGDYDAVIPEISGTAWMTGEHTFLCADADPLPAGLRMA